MKEGIEVFYRIP